MAIFDFLKKAELEKIKSLELELSNIREEQILAQNKLLELETEITSLSRYRHIVDTEKKAIELIEKAKEDARKIIIEAENNSTLISIEADKLYANAKNKELEANYFYNTTKDKAKEEASKELDLAKKESLKMKHNAKQALDEATQQASIIIRNAETKAIEIAGDAYKVKVESDNLSKTVTALRNTVKGYGDDYIIPTYSFIDKLAEDFSYTDAGIELKKARARSRLMVKNDLASKCDYVEANRRITAINFTTDAFNGKVDTILAGVKQDNYGTLKQKITDAYYLVNNLGKAFRNAVVTEQYLESRIEELRWAVIAIELRNNEREEQKQIKDQIREEERAIREFEKAIKDAEKEEATIKKALEKAKLDLESATEAQKQKYEQRLAELEEKLKLAELKEERAKSMAQQTKSGHVYVISNIGSFGENIYKIGMTRRLEPIDRVRELGDASVPFSFDIHAMIYTDNAPALENDLHKFFRKYQVNKVNNRKEFFNIGILDIKERIESKNIQAKWTMLADASQYRETKAIEKGNNSYENSLID